MLLVRGRDDEVRFHEINALSAMLIERLRENTDMSGLQCLDALLAERNDLDAAILARGRQGDVARAEGQSKRSSATLTRLARRRKLLHSSA